MSLTPEEQKLIEGCKKGDEKAWLALYRAYGNDIGRFLKSMLRHSNEIDDLVQKVFLEFLSSLERFRGEASIRTWLHRIARHVALHEIRSYKRRTHYVTSYAEMVDKENKGHEDEVTARNSLSVIQEVLLELKAAFREVWVLREVVQLSVLETAHVLEIGAATVRTRHYRAREQILARLQQLDAQDKHRLGQSPVKLELLTAKGGS